MQKALAHYPKLLEGRFKKRINRFVSEVQVTGYNTPQNAHLPSTGRLAELLTTDAKVFLEHHQKSERKTAFSLRLVEYQGILIDLTAHYANPYTESLWEQSLLKLPYTPVNAIIKREWKYQNHRFDFLITPHKREKPPLVLEVKSVNLVIDNIAHFPDAPTSRGVNHLKTLIELGKNGYLCAVLFLVMREDAIRFKPHKLKDPTFAQACLKAQKNDVIFMAQKCAVRKEGIYPAGEVPLSLN